MKYLKTAVVISLSIFSTLIYASSPVIRIQKPKLMYEVRATPSPLDQAVVSENPPTLMWPDKYPHLGPVLDGVEATKEDRKPHVTYRVRLSKDSLFKKDVMQATRKWACFNPLKILSNGVWYWQYGYVNGNQTEWSYRLSFTVNKSAVVFSPPSLETLLSKLPKEHPRVLLDKKEWNQFIDRNRNNPEALQYVNFANKTLTKKLKHISVEIDTTGIRDLDNQVKRKTVLIRESRKIVDREEKNIEALCRSYLLTKDDRYYENAMGRISTILSWKKSKYFARDFNSSVLLSICTLGYDAFYDKLSVNEKKLLLEGIRENGNLFYEEFVNHLENYIADNHVWQMTLRILTMASFASYGDLPEANTWVDYCYNVWIARFPGLNQDGAWHEGDSYFHVNLRTLIEVPAFYSRITGFDFFSKKWYAGSAKYVIYQQPPFSKSGGHGNSHESVNTPNGVRVGYADALARECNNTFAADYVRFITQRDPEILSKGFLGKAGDLTWYRLTTKKKLPTGKGLADLKNTKVFPQTGTAVMLTSLNNPEKNAMLTFRSSPFGSTSHAHADQNAFNTFYGGKSIFYSTGHRTGFSDEHCMYVYRNSRSHNTIQPDSMGQKIGTEGYGWIPRYYEGETISYVLGDASNAYGEVSSPLWLKRGKLSNINYSPENGWDKNRVKTFRRHVVQLGKTGVYVIYDDLEGLQPVAWTYQLHTIEQPMSISKQKDYTLVKGENTVGVSDAYLFCSEPIETSQTDQFFYPAVNWMNKTTDNGNPVDYKNQWHVSSTTPKSRVCRFLTVIDTHGKDSADRKITKQGDLIVIGDWVINANLSNQGDAKLKIENKKANCNLMLNQTTVISEIVNGKLKRVELVDKEPELEI